MLQPNWKLTMSKSRAAAELYEIIRLIDDHEDPRAEYPQPLAALRALRLCVRQITHAKAQSSQRLALN
jgi:hypothetical protein